MNTAFELPEELTIYSALETRDRLKIWAGEVAAANGGVGSVSADAVAAVDGAGLQLLMALSASGVKWRLVSASQIFVDACHRLGLDAWLNELESEPRAEPS